MTHSIQYLEDINLENHNCKDRETESITFRINKSYLSRLRRYAQQRNISTNTLANQIIKQFIDWYGNAADIRFISINRDLIQKLLEKYTESEIAELSKEVIENEIKRVTLLMKGKYTIDNALDVVETWLKVSNYPFRHECNSRSHDFVIQHDLGKKWSLYLAEKYKYIFMHFGLDKFSFDLSDNILYFTVYID